MDIEYKYTKHQVARTSIADAISDKNWYLIKYCTELKSTYQIRMLLFLVISKKGRLIIRVRKECLLSDNLKKLIKENKPFAKLEKTL